MHPELMLAQFCVFNASVHNLLCEKLATVRIYHQWQSRWLCCRMEQAKSDWVSG